MPITTRVTSTMSTEEPARALFSLKKRRGVVRRSLTKLYGTIRTLEATPDVDHAKRLTSKLEELDKDFKSIQFGVVDLLDEDSEEMEKEQEALDKHEDDVTSASLRLQKLVKLSPSSVDTTGEKQSSRKLARIQRRLRETDEALVALKEDHDDMPLLERYQEQISDIKRELSAVYEELVTLDLPDEHHLVVQHGELEKLQFKCSHHTKKLLSCHTSSKPSSSTQDKASKLPKLDVPTFSGNVLHWQQFWEQFEVSVHSRSNLSDIEKLVYLQQAIKNSPARTCIEGLSRSGDQYGEAIECLKGRYNRPRLIHRAHVRNIMEAPPLKDGSAKELRHLHDILQQHLRALKSMELEPDPSFITSIIELKLDTTTLFEWQKHTQESIKDVPPYQDILDFLNLRAQASESLAGQTKRNSAQPPGKKSAQSSGNVASFTAASANSNHSRCIVCTSERHPLYACSSFKALSHEEKRST